jgi:sugar phosphate isomerase/epimerase
VKLGLVTDSLPDLPLPDLLSLAAALGLDCLEFGCGNWSSAPHLNLPGLLEDEQARRCFAQDLARGGLAISALNCSGNPLHPGEPGRRHAAVTRDTIRLAGLIGVDRVVMMSGCPGGPGDRNSNWITTAWPPELRDVLRWQWDEVLIPYWRDLAHFARSHGVPKLCLELHGHQNVYSVATFHRLRDAVGETIGVNFDPSHLFWMGADPLVAVRALGSAIYHVHAKDTRIEPALAQTNGIIDTVPADRFREGSWNYVTLRHGDSEEWWRALCAALHAAGYDDVLSIEHEDFMMPALEGVQESVALLKDVAFDGAARD